MDFEIVVQKEAEKADAFSKVRFVEISGTLLGIASSLNQSSSLIKEGPLLIYFKEKLPQGHGPFVFALICRRLLLKYFKL